ncbi:MAG: PEP-CTERM sorting domain-containing protein, partial [Planctomycetota bacterium]
GNCCRGFLATYYPYQSITYATFVNAAGSFFANGGAVAGSGGGAGVVGGTGTGRYNNRTGMAANDKGTWRIRAGKNAFGGAMGLLGKYGATAKYTDPALPGSVFAVTSSWAMVPPLGRPFQGTVHHYGPKGTTYWWNPYSKTDMWWFYSDGTSTINAIGTGTLWTTGQVGAFVKTGAYHTSQWRTGFDSRTAGGKGSIQLVTPTLTHWLSTGFNSHTAQIGMLKIQVPEPAAVLLLAVGAGVLVALHRVSRRR